MVTTLRVMMSETCILVTWLEVRHEIHTGIRSEAWMGRTYHAACGAPRQESRVSAHRWSFVPERFDGIQPRGLPRGEVSEHHPHRPREAEGEEHHSRI